MWGVTPAPGTGGGNNRALDEVRYSCFLEGAEPAKLTYITDGRSSNTVHCFDIWLMIHIGKHHLGFLPARSVPESTKQNKQIEKTMQPTRFNQWACVCVCVDAAEFIVA
ncbi:UNVERIFIED_CONTAM: hypothetical protein FKN15_016592 [Acipenser sinensis]